MPSADLAPQPSNPSDGSAPFHPSDPSQPPDPGHPADPSQPPDPSHPADPSYPSDAGPGPLPAGSPVERPPLSPTEVAALRRHYALGGLAESHMAPDPVTQFGRWLAQAVAAGLTEPNAMVLATASAGGRPSARTVLLKGYDNRGFAFFTNIHSRKGREVGENPYASLVFPWFAMERQVVVVGRVESVSREETAAYVASRPYASQLGAWASAQSEVIPSREVLEERYSVLARRWPEGTAVPVPDFWGGFRVVPDTVEFWQGRESRLHDRLRYRRTAHGWELARLSP